MEKIFQQRLLRLKTIAGNLLCCVVVWLGIQTVATSFLDHIHHPGWDFTLRHGEVSCLVDLHVDPYDIFSGAVKDETYLPFRVRFEQEENALDFRWVGGYPPWEYTLLLPFSFLSLHWADAAYKVLELVALFVVVFFSFRRSSRIQTSRWKRLLLAYSFVLLPPVAWDFAFKYGNWAVLFCAGVAVLIVCLDKGWQILAGLVWAFLMIKPQQGIWFAIPLLFRRQFKTIGVAVATCLVASVPPAVLCGKSPVELILEIPKFRLQRYFETTLFPSSVYSFLDELLFPKAAIVLGLIVCLVFCLWASWKLRREKTWFSALQPAFICICAGYPLWPQDWLFFFFPILFLLEIWAGPGKISSSTRKASIILVIALCNPLSWALRYSSFAAGTILAESEVLSYATWFLFSFLVFLVQSGMQVADGYKETDSAGGFVCGEPVQPDAISDSRPQSYPFARLAETVPVFLFLTICLAGLAFAAFLKNGRFLGIDDADIFFGYAKNLCNGRGLSFALNGGRCEGTTSMLWLLLCSMCFKLRLGEPGVLGLSFTLLLASQWIWLRVLSRLLPARNRSMPFLFAYVVMVLSSAGYVTWMTVTLMDTVLWGFLVAWMTLAFLRGTEEENAGTRENAFFVVPFVLAPWARPEAMLVVPCCLALSALFRMTRGKGLRSEFVRGAGFAVSLAALTGFRLAYFGYPFPNTYYAKVSPSFIYNVQEGTRYALQFVHSSVFTYLCLLCSGFVLLKMAWTVFSGRTRGDAAFSVSDFLWMWVFALFLSPILAGGDHFAYFRFFQPVWPLLCVMLVSVVARFFVPFRRSPSGFGWPCVILLFAFVLFSFFSSSRKWRPNPGWSQFSPIRQEFSIAEKGRNDGRMLSEMFDGLPEKPILGVITAGGISRTYQGRIVDLMGLNNVDIAHHPGDRIGIKNHAAFEPELFDSLHVDIMTFSPDSFHSRALKGMLETESFVSNWRCGRIRKAATSEETRPFFVKKGFLDWLLSTGEFSFRDSYRFEGGRWTEIKEAAIN